MQRTLSGNGTDVMTLRWIQRDIACTVGALVCAFIYLILSFQNAKAVEKPSLSAIDRTRLAEAFRLGDRLSDLADECFARVLRRAAID